ncbi:MAG: type II toxin-antitoxin system Phd/YefM family antitoxin [Rhodanobacteraceae bacterium]
MSEVINVHEAKTHLSRLLDKAHAGEEIILGKAGKPYARLVPLKPPAKRRFGSLKGFQLDESFFEPLPENELAAWEGRGK